MECRDFLEFQDMIKKMRDVDDKLVYALNCSVPSQSFRDEINPSTSCKELYEKLQTNHKNRDKAIRDCINFTNSRVQELKYAKESNPAALKAFNKEITKLRLLKSELTVEEVVNSRSEKLYYERCRDFFKPSNLKVN
ncbi:Caffeine-induced death protein 2 [Nesidiocoris tenuis]|uniref:Protein MIX23 n=1 Tax=Nesidiocoris tenuis TaxID=355587 RepID=A0ABN7A8E7_9HEMI|nr:Caffeine-induced death protein 2 [Nesidiocoris tenuis]